MKVSARVRVSGPLVTYVEGFADALSARGYTDFSIANQLRLVAHLSRWLAGRAIALSQITPYTVEQFIAERRHTHTMFRSPRALAPFLLFLRSLDVVPAAPSEPLPADELLRKYHSHLSDDRELTLGRVRGYVAVADDFLANRSPGDLVAADVTAYVQAHANSGGLLGRLTALRSVLKFVFLIGKTSVNLTHAVPSASCRRLVSLPKGLDNAEVDEMLATCDRRTTTGRRDYAALLLMVRLGLRAGEVATLTLDDIDWRVGEVVIFGKSGSTGRLPVPNDVGESIVSYLRRRPRHVETRCLFLPCRAPYRDATAGMVCSLARRALLAADISPSGAHRLRHTAATQMLRRGASLTEIAQVLRHRHIDTTAIYAKVDLDRLSTLAPPWPTGYRSRLEQLQKLAQHWPGGGS